MLPFIKHVTERIWLQGYFIPEHEATVTKVFTVTHSCKPLHREIVVEFNELVTERNEIVIASKIIYHHFFIEILM